MAFCGIDRFVEKFKGLGQSAKIAPATALATTAGVNLVNEFKDHTASI